MRKILATTLTFALLFGGVFFVNNKPVSAQTASTGCPTTGAIKVADIRLDNLPSTSITDWVNGNYVDNSIARYKIDPRAKGGASPFDVVVIFIDNPCPGKYFTPQHIGYNLLIDGVDYSIFLDGTQNMMGTTDYLDRIKLDSNTSYKYFYAKLKIEPNEAIVDAITNNKKVTVRVWAQYGLFDNENRTVTDGLTADAVFPLYRSLCVPIYGTGKFNVTYMRGKASGFDSYSLYQDAIDVSSNGFATKDPFAKYINQFAFWVDIKKHDDTAWLGSLRTFLKKSGQDGVNNVMSQMSAASSCKNGGIKILETSLAGTDLSGVSSYFGDGFFVSATGYTKIPLVIHEFGHAFAGLVDESTRTQNAPATFFPNGIRNCSINTAADYSFSGVNYGGSYQGCIARSIYFPGSASNLMPIFRSTDKSIMNSPADSNKFNVVQCAYILRRIKNNSLKVNFPECAGLSVQK